MIKGYIFDMDGTLLDSLSAWKDISNRYLASLGLAGDSQLDEIMKHMSLDNGAAYLIDRFHLMKTVPEVISDIQQLMIDQYKYQLSLKEGVLKFLEKCSQKHYQMCVLTASDSKLAKLALKRLKVLHYFQEVYACHEIQLNKKDPQSYLYIAEKMNLKPQECVVVEDALYAMKTAKQAGFYVKAIYDEENKDDLPMMNKVADEIYMSFQDMEV